MANLVSSLGHAELLDVAQHLQTLYVIKLRLTGEYTYANDYFCRTVGLPQNVLLEQNIFQSLISEDHPLLINAIESCRAEPNLPQLVTLRQCSPKSGDTITFRWEFIYKESTEGAPVYLLGLGQDISKQGFPNKNDSQKDLLVINTDLEGEILNLNAVASHTLGYTNDDVTKQSFFSLVHPSQKRSIEATFHGLLQDEQETSEVELRLLTDKNTYRWIRWIAKIDPKHQYVRFQGKDITKKKEYKLSRQRLSHSLLDIYERSALEKLTLLGLLNYTKHKVEALFPNCTFTLWRYSPRRGLLVQLLSDEDRTIPYRQTYFEELSTRVSKQYHDKKRSLIDTLVAKADNVLGLLRLEYNLPDKKWTFEERYYFESLARILSSAHETDKLTRSEENYKSVLDALHEGIVVHDKDDSIKVANQSAANILGLTMDQLLGKSSFDPQWQALHEDGTPMLPEEHPSMITLSTGDSVDKKLMNVHIGNGERRIILANSRPIIHKSGKLYGAVASFTDVTSEKEALKKLQQSEKLLSDIANTVPGLIMRYVISVNDEHIIEYISKGVEELWELSVKEALEDSMKVWAKVHPEDVEGVRTTLEESRKHLSPWHHEMRFIMNDGRIKWVVGHAMPQRRANGDTVWHTLSLDITKRKFTELEVETKSRLLESINQNIKEGIYRTDGKKMVYANQAFADIFGFDSIEEAKQADLASFYLDENHRQELIDSIKQHGLYTNTEVQFRRKDGTPFWVSASAIRTVYPDGSQTYDGAIRDITEQREARTKIQRLAHVAEKTADAILICNKKGDITWCNTSVEKVLGYTEKELIYKNVGDLPQIGGEKLENRITGCFEEDCHCTDIIPLIHRNGQESWVDMEVTPTYNKHGQFNYTIIVMRDITRLVKKQHELEALLETTTKQNMRLKEFSYITSHNIRSSVANLLGLSQLLRADPSNELYLDMMSRSTEKLDSTIRNLSVLLQVENKSINSEVCNVLDFIDRGVAQLTQQLQKSEVKLHLDVSPSLTVLCIPAYLDSVLSNLISNAIKYGTTYHKKDVWITAHVENGFVHLTCRDSGHGIDLEKHGDQMFRLGTRLHDTGDGQGMGLYLVKRQIEAMNGRIEVESQLGEGTTVSVWLPSA
ncbi:MAG: PAS domain S-box protein [Bacteroidota bacterium]